MSAPLPPTQLTPVEGGSTSIPPHMVPPLQFLHVPGRPASKITSRSSRALGALHPPTQVPVPVYSLNRIPSASQISSLASSYQQHQASVVSNGPHGSRPPTAPTQEWFSKDKGRVTSAQTARVLFRRSASSSASVADTATSGDEENVVGAQRRANVGSSRPATLSSGEVSPTRLTEDVSWTDRSPRVASGTRRQPPPLASALQGHLDREIKFIQQASDREGACSVLDPMELLQPHREALRMLAEGLPSYAGLLFSIMGAYDAAIKNQAEVTAAARVVSNTAVQVRLSHEAEVTDLKETIEAAEARCRSVQHALQLKLQESKVLTTAAAGSNVEKENAALRQQITDLELEKTSDLEKMMTLIVAIKECDSRVKSLEDALQEARSKLDEMNSLKKMMGESQLELGQLKVQYKDAVPLSRYTNATHELEAQVLESRREIKRVRRLCIARGSAIDSLEKKLKAAVDELDRFRMAAGSKQVRDALTPRPDWLAVQKAIPELKDFVAEVPIEMIDGNAQQAPRLVGGLTETSLQVHFLADKIAELQNLSTAVSDATTPPRQVGTSSPSAIPPPETSTSSSTPGMLKHRQSFAPAASPMVASTAVISVNSIPLIALGSSITSSHIREVGVVPRVTFDKEKLRSILHEFYTSAQKKFAAELELSPPSTTDIIKHYLSFCTVLFATNPEVRQQVQCNSAYLTYNLCDAARTSTLPQLVLFPHVLDGTMPLRIALDALRAEDEVRHELQALCEAHNKNRLRRATVLELVVPLLPFKGRDEIEELRSALGVESTVDVSLLTVSSSKFMCTLFEQECAEGMKLYVSVVEKLSAVSTVQEGVRCITTAAVLDVVAEVEPQTEQRVIDSLIKGDVNEESVFPLEHTLSALRSAALIRATPPAAVAKA